MCGRIERTTTVYLSMGSNSGDRLHNLAVARNRMSALPSVSLKQFSSVYETEPVDMPGAGPFLNAVCSLETSLSPRALLRMLEDVEGAMGRRDKGGCRPRVIDLDVLLYGALETRGEGLVLPHPRMHERRFVLVPLCEIAPLAHHPVLGKTVREILLDLGDKNGVRFYGRFPEEVDPAG